MKYAYLVIIGWLVLLTHTLHAQDKLVMMDGTELKVKVLEIKPEVITYKKFTNLTGPTYEAPRNTIHKIVFQNGDSELITALSKDGKTGISFSFIGGDTLKVTAVAAGSGAAEIGILPGDKIIAIGTTKVGSFGSESKVYDLLDGPVGSTVDVTIVRGKLKTPLPFTVERRKPAEASNANDLNIEPVNIDNVISISERVDEQNKTNVTTTAYDDGGFYLSVAGGGGGTNMRGGGVGMFEVEIGDFLTSANTTVGAKFGLLSLTGPEYNLFFIKYSSAVYLGNHAKSGFHVGGDFGMAFYPDGDQPLWDVALTMGYGIRVIRNLRIELFGNLELMPTFSFSNFGVVGWGGIRIGGIF